MTADSQDCDDDQHLLHGLFEHAPDAIVVVGGDGRIIRANAQVQALFGYSCEEIVGQPIELLVPERYRGSHISHRQGYFAHARTRSMGAGLELYGARKDGSELPVDIMLSPFHSSTGALVIGVVRDITERKHAEESLHQAREELEQRVRERTRELAAINEALQDSEERLRLIVEGVQDYAIVMLDPDGLIASWNFGAQRIHGYRSEEIAATHFSRFHPPEDLGRDKPAELLGEAKLNGRAEDEGWRVRKDGSRFWANVVINALRDEAGKLRGFAKVTRDMTQRRLTEEALAQAQKMEAVGQLTGGIAHDFNNLLTVISGNLQMLQERVGHDPFLQKLANAASKGAWRGAELTRKLLAFSRRQPLQPRTIDVAGLIEGMVEMLRRTLGETVRVDAQTAIGLWRARADPGQVETAILNLALNARDAMPRGGTVHLQAANASLDEADAAQEADASPGDYVMLAVADSGTGMTPDVLRRAFEPFFTTKEADKGTGLGLSMVYGFIKQSGGYLSVESEPGRGTTVRLYLPRAQSSAEIAAQQPAPERHAARGETVLLVEDDDGVRELAATFLTHLGYHVLEAANGRAALAILDQGQPIDLLFTDMVMPGGIGGRELAAEVRSSHPRMAVLFTSGYTETALHEERPHNGTDQLLKKPYTKEDLACLVRAALDGVR